MSTIDIQDLTRVYRVTTGVVRRRTKEVLALDGLTLSVARGELFGLVGPNGAGKTTTVKILTTLLTPTAGEARVLGVDVARTPEQVRPRIGFVLGGERGLYWRLSGYDNLIYFSNLYRLPPAVQKQRIPYLLELVGLRGRGDEKVQGYSRGMKQRLHIARALLHDPEVLFLDEPTMGLDPVGARETRQVIRGLQAENKTILLTTHYMFEADELCQRVAVINHGRIVALDTPAALKRSAGNTTVIEVELAALPPAAVARLRALPGVSALAVDERDHGPVLRLNTDNGTAAVIPIVSTLQALGLVVEHLAVREATLEDAYVHLVGAAT